MKAIFAGYFVLLNLLLLTAAPTELVRWLPELRGLLRALTPFAHLASFALLALLACTASRRLPRWLIVIGLMAFAAATEVVQNVVPGRACDGADLLANLGGLALGSGFCYAVYRWMSWQSKRLEGRAPCLRSISKG